MNTHGIPRISKTLTAIRRLSPVFHTTDALRAGVHPKSLYRLRDTGRIERLDRGLYRLADLPAMSNADLITVALKVPRGVICLVSALYYHELTTQIPHMVYCAVRRPGYHPRVSTPPVQFFSLSAATFDAGIEEYSMDGTKVRIYSIEKTLADCFKFRNRIGLEVAVEALRLYRERRKSRIDDLVRFATVCRVERVMRPYLEAIL